MPLIAIIIIGVSKLKPYIKVISILCVIDVIMIMAVLVLHVGHTVRLGYGRDFFRIDCQTLLMSLKEYDDAVTLAALKKYSQGDIMFKDCLGPASFESANLNNDNATGQSARFHPPFYKPSGQRP